MNKHAHLFIFAAAVFAGANAGVAQTEPSAFGTPASGDAAPRQEPAAQPSRMAAPAAESGASAASAPRTGGAQPQGATTAGDYSSSSGERGMDKIFDVNRDSVDLQNGTMQWKGKTMNLGDSRAVRARIERYLSAPVTEGSEAAKHAKILDEIEALLSPKNLTARNHAANFQRAWTLLFKAGEMEVDAGNCLAIASQVDKAYRDGKAANDLRRTRAQEEKLRDHHRLEARLRARDLESRRDEAARRPTGGGGGGSARGGGEGAKPAGGNTEPQTGTEELSAKRQDISRSDANILKADVDIATIEMNSRLSYQSQIVTLLFQRRFKHAIIATSFYRYLFDSTKHEMKVGEKQIKEMLPVSNFSPTVVSVDWLAREAMKDVDTGIKSVRQLYDTGRRYGALQRMQETFLLGEYCPQMMDFGAAQKTVLLGVWNELQTLERVADARDLNEAEESIKRLQKVASDFPATQVLSRIKNAKSMSNLALFSAKQAALAGDMEKAGASLLNATKIWPQNPAVVQFTNQVEGRADVLTQKVPEFDRLLEQKKYRDIFAEKETFGLSFIQDKVRAEKLKNVLNMIGEIDGRILNAKVLRDQGANYMAWDVLHDAMRIDANDPKLGEARMALSPLIADYARALMLAEQHEKEGHAAVSFTWYLAAQDINPASEHCRQAVARLTKAILAGNK